MTNVFPIIPVVKGKGTTMGWWVVGRGLAAPRELWCSRLDLQEGAAERPGPPGDTRVTILSPFRAAPQQFLSGHVSRCGYIHPGVFLGSGLEGCALIPSSGKLALRSTRKSFLSIIFTGWRKTPYHVHTAIFKMKLTRSYCRALGTLRTVAARMGGVGGEWITCVCTAKSLLLFTRNYYALLLIGYTPIKKSLMSGGEKGNGIRSLCKLMKINFEKNMEGSSGFMNLWLCLFKRW